MPNIVERLREIGPRMGSPGEIFPEDFATIAEGADEIERLRDLLHRSWFKGAHMEPGLQDEVLAYFGHSAEAKDG